MLTPRTQALLAVDLFGVPADDAALRRIADDHGLWYVHDAAQSFGASREGRAAGALAHAVVVSFTCGKTLFAGEGGAILTDDDDLYYRLVWSTQHPYRQKRELGLGFTNEFALNFRIHPLAAVWADADFELALGRLQDYTSWADRVVDRLNESNLTEPLRYADSRIRPTYFRLTAAWRNQPKPETLLHELRAADLGARIAPFGITLLYRSRTIRRQFLVRARPGCRIAERQARRRFELWPTPPGGG